MAEYFSVEEARRMDGLRLVTIRGIAGPPWSESAKAIFQVKGIPFVRVGQEPQVTNDALQTWTGHDNAPIAMYEGERPRAGWDEILLLAERLAPEPRLIPEAPAERAWFFGLAHELCGEDGLGWNRRHLMCRQGFDPDDETGIPREIADYLAARYDYSEAAAERASVRVAEIVTLFADQLRAQQQAGNEYLLGDSLTALDIYWACFAALLEPLPDEQCPMPQWLRESYSYQTEAIRQALDPALLEHRDRVYQRFLELPVDV